MIFGEPWDLKLPDICLTGEEKLQKTLTQETCPGRGSNPGPLSDRRTCYRLLHSGGLLVRVKKLETSRKTYQDPVSSITKPTWGNRGANSEPQRWETTNSLRYELGIKLSSTRDRLDVWDTMKLLYWMSVNSKDAGRPCLMHHHRGGWNEMKRNEWDDCGDMVEWNLWQGKNGKTPRKTYPDFILPTIKPTWSDRYANLGPQRRNAST